MNPLRSLLLRSTAGIWNRRRSRLFADRKKQLKNDDFTILSCNCIAGVVYHDFGLPFRTPIVNLFLTCEDFIRFCEDPKHYLSAEFLPYTGEIRKKYPLADLDGLTLHLVHYSTFDSAKEAWERRKQRVNFGQLSWLEQIETDLMKHFLIALTSCPIQRFCLFIGKMTTPTIIISKVLKTTIRLKTYWTGTAF